MAKLNQPVRPRRGGGPITSNTTTPDTLTHEGGPAYTRTPQSELFITAVSTYHGEDTFYEKAADRSARLADLARQVAVQHPSWFVGFVRYLRGTANIRTASVVIAAHGADAMRQARITGPVEKDRGPVRRVVSGCVGRTDEVKEFVAYWRANISRSLPGGVQRGLQDALEALDEYGFAKYDGGNGDYRIGDVIDLVHPKPRDARQSVLFKHAIDKRHGRTEETDPQLQMLVRRERLLSVMRDSNSDWVPSAEDVSAAGLTWENLLSALGDKVPKSTLWEKMIHGYGLGYMAMLRNLRNMDAAGISTSAFNVVADRLTDPRLVAASRQMPYRFLSAFDAVNNVRWHQPLETAANLALNNIPELPGTTDILIDTSASMGGTFSGRSVMSPAKAAALFGVALSLRNLGRVRLYGFADEVFQHRILPGSSLLTTVNQFVARTGEVGHGTRIAQSLRAVYSDADRVFVFSDQQTFGGWGGDANTAIPATVPLYGFNLAGYGGSCIAAGTPNRHELGGLTDNTFRLIPLIEAGEKADWPFAYMREDGTWHQPK